MQRQADITEQPSPPLAVADHPSAGQLAARPRVLDFLDICLYACVSNSTDKALRSVLRFGFWLRRRRHCRVVSVRHARCGQALAACSCAGCCCVDLAARQRGIGSQVQAAHGACLGTQALGHFPGWVGRGCRRSSSHACRIARVSAARLVPRPCLCRALLRAEAGKLAAAAAQRAQGCLAGAGRWRQAGGIGAGQRCQCQLLLHRRAGQLPGRSQSSLEAACLQQRSCLAVQACAARLQQGSQQALCAGRPGSSSRASLRCHRPCGCSGGLQRSAQLQGQRQRPPAPLSC